MTSRCGAKRFLGIQFPCQPGFGKRLLLYTPVQRSNFELRFPVLVSIFSAEIKSTLTIFVDRQENVLMAILGVKFTRFGIIFSSFVLPLVLLFLSV